MKAMGPWVKRPRLCKGAQPKVRKPKVFVHCRRGTSPIHSLRLRGVLHSSRLGAKSSRGAHKKWIYLAAFQSTLISSVIGVRTTRLPGSLSAKRAYRGQLSGRFGQKTWEGCPCYVLTDAEMALAGLDVSRLEQPGRLRSEGTCIL